MNQNPSLRDFLKIPLTLFNIINIQIFRSDSLRKKSFIRSVIAGILVTNAVGQTFLELVFFCVEPLPDIIGTMSLVAYTGYSSVSVVKLCEIYRELVLIHEIVDELEKIHPRTKADAIAFRSVAYYKQIGSFLRIVSVYHFSVTMMFAAFALFQSIFEYIWYGGDFQKTLPFAMYYPFDPLDWKVFPVVYFTHLMCSPVLSIFFAGSDYLLLSTVHLICMHFENLSKQIMDFVPKGTDEDVTKLMTFLRRHQNLLSLSSKINKVYNFTILVNYLATGVLICIAAFLIAIGIGAFDLLKFTAFLISAVGHFYFVCHYGTKLLEMSTEISLAVFSHQWYRGNARYRKMLPLIIERAQKPAVLTALKFFVVTMLSFQNLMSTSYQIFTLLKTSYE